MGWPARGSLVGIYYYLFLILFLSFSPTWKRRGRGSGVENPVLGVNALWDPWCVAVPVCLLDDELLRNREALPFVASCTVTAEDVVGRPSVGKLCLKGGWREAQFCLRGCAASVGTEFDFFLVSSFSR